jgi:hypothetical protein
MLWKNSAEIRSDFRRHEASLQRLIDTVKFVSKTAAQQPVDAHTVTSTSSYQAPISTISNNTPTKKLASSQSNTSPPVHVSAAASNLQQDVRTAIVSAAAAAYTATDRQRAPRITATAPPPFMNTAGNFICTFVMCQWSFVILLPVV